VTLSYLFNVDVTPSTKLYFLLYFIELWENRLRYKNYFSGHPLGKWVWAFRKKIIQQIRPFASFGSANNEKIAINWLFSFKMFKLCCGVFPINNFRQQSYSSIYSEDKCEKSVEIDACLCILQRYITSLHLLKCTPCAQLTP